MTKKRKAAGPTLEDILTRPWCYYCERDFDNLKVLVDHQKARHFKCGHCNKRLGTSKGLAIHTNQVHKVTVTTVSNALPNREGLEPEIFAMEGIPKELTDAHHQRLTAEYFRRENAHRLETGNPPPGTKPEPKKQKIETPEEIKQRLAEFKAKKKAAKEGGVDSDGDTNMAGIKQEPMIKQEPGTVSIESPIVISEMLLIERQAGVLQQATFPVSGAEMTMAHPVSSMYGTYMPYSASPSNPYGPGMPPRAAYGSPIQPYGPGPMPTNTMAPYMAPISVSSGASQAFNPAFNYSASPHLPQGQDALYGAPPMLDGSNNDVSSQSPPPESAPRTNSLPSVPGLPQKPQFELPPIPKEVMERMHAGPSPGIKYPYLPSQQPTTQTREPPSGPNNEPTNEPTNEQSNEPNRNSFWPAHFTDQIKSDSIDELIEDGKAKAAAKGSASSDPMDSVDEAIARATGEYPNQTATSRLPATNQSSMGVSTAEPEPQYRASGTPYYQPNGQSASTTLPPNVRSPAVPMMYATQPEPVLMPMGLRTSFTEPKLGPRTSFTESKLDRQQFLQKEFAKGRKYVFYQKRVSPEEFKAQRYSGNQKPTETVQSSEQSQAVTGPVDETA